MLHWIFDLDGTLVNSAPSYIKIVVGVVKALGVTLSPEQEEQIPKVIPRKFLEQVLTSCGANTMASPRTTELR